MKLTYLIKIGLISSLLAGLPIAQVAAVATQATTSESNATRLSHLQTRGAAEIARRVAMLQSAATVIAASQKLIAADKSSLGSQIQLEITNLQALSSKLGADTDLATARADVRSIVTEYRVYVEMLPKARLLTALDAQQTVAANLTTLAGKLQTTIARQQAAGHDVAAMQTLLTDMQKQIANYNTATSGLETAIMNVTPDQYNTNHAILTSKRDILKSNEADLKAARQDGATIISDLRAQTN